MTLRAPMMLSKTGLLLAALVLLSGHLLSVIAQSNNAEPQGLREDGPARNQLEQHNKLDGLQLQGETESESKSRKLSKGDALTSSRWGVHVGCAIVKTSHDQPTPGCRCNCAGCGLRRHSSCIRLDCLQLSFGHFLPRLGLDMTA